MSPRAGCPRPRPVRPSRPPEGEATLGFDFIDDYAVHPALRNDLGLLWLVTVDRQGVQRTEAVPLALDYCHTRLADRAEYGWIADRLTGACAQLGTRITDEGDRLAVDWPHPAARATVSA